MPIDEAHPSSRKELLEYRRPDLNLAERRAFRRLWLGILAGCGLSVCLYRMLWTRNDFDLTPLIVDSVSKFLAYYVLMFVRDWRYFGIGLVLSIPIALLIFFAAALMWMRF
jgi:hypothetical protein